MVWRPSPPRPNPLHALRRVVGGEDTAPVQQPTVVPVTSPASDAPASAESTEREAPSSGSPGPAEPAGPTGSAESAGPTESGSPGPAEREAPSAERRAVALKERYRERRRHTAPRPASDPEPSHLRPDRPAQTVITSTPVEAAPSPSSPELELTPLPPTYEVAVDPPEWWLSRTAAPRPARTAPPLQPLAFDVPRPSGFRQTLTVMLICLGLWTLVDAPALARSASTGPIGTRRTVALDVLDPIARVSAWLGLDRVDHVASSLLHRQHHTAPPAPAAVPPPAIVKRTAPIVPAPTVLRVPTVANPLRVLAVGDSLGLSFGQSLATKLDGTSLVRTTVDAREGTGLARPDAFDWIAQLRADVARVHPDIVVVSFGGNDDQDLLVGGRFVPFDSGPWQAIYAARVQQVIATVHPAFLLWSGLPVVRSAAKTTRLMTVMSITQAALAGRHDVVFVDNRPTLADAAGHYVTALPNASGNAVIVRQPDGIHETPAGADRLADKAIAAMRAAWKLVL